MSTLYDSSIKIIKNNQTSSGAYIASPNFPTYKYCWFRDGSFISYSMDVVGQQDSASHYHNWAATCIINRAEIITRAISKAHNNRRHRIQDYLHTRYNLDGSDVADRGWGNFQLDGFGTWLWALGEHVLQYGGSLLENWALAASLIANYLKNLWDYPCYDCWEEFPNRVHPYTLAAIFGGLQAYSKISGQNFDSTLCSIRQHVIDNYVIKHHFTKFSDSFDVDANLLGLSTPYNLVTPDHPLMQATTAQIENELYDGGGIHRYKADTFYGGGEWLLLTSWLGWYYTEVGKYDQARIMLEWVERQADRNGYLPEQVPTNLNNPNDYEPWVKRWGTIANPLLWSHAMYLLLHHKLSF